MGDSIYVNGNQMSWGSIDLKVAGELFTGFTGITYADKRERVVAYGMGRHQAPRGRSRGKYTVDPVKLTGWKGSVTALREGLAALATGGLSYGDVEFLITLAYSELDEPPVIVEIGRCVWAGSSSSEDESAENLKEEIEISAMYIKRNGLTLYDTSQGAPNP